MLNLWISNLSDSEEPDLPQSCDHSQFDHSSLSPLSADDWEQDLVLEDRSDTSGDDEPYHSAPVAYFPPGALSSVPVVSTEGGSSEHPAPDSMPSARFFYSNPSSSTQRRNRQHQQGSGSSAFLQGISNPPSAPHASNSRSQPQIHVQVNLPGSANAPAAPVAQGIQQHVPTMIGMSLPGAGHQMESGSASSASTNAGTFRGPDGYMQRADVPMLFHGASLHEKNMMNTAVTANAAAEMKESSFYSTFQPEPDFLEFQSMYFHLCTFYHKYGHANVPKHGDCFVLGSWVEQLRQRKHIQDLQESGISVAAMLDPISKRQSDLLESLGFRWHISANENQMIVKHLMFINSAVRTHGGVNNLVQNNGQVNNLIQNNAQANIASVSLPAVSKNPIQDLNQSQANSLSAMNMSGGMSTGSMPATSKNPVQCLNQRVAVAKPSLQQLNLAQAHTNSNLDVPPQMRGLQQPAPSRIVSNMDSSVKNTKDSIPQVSEAIEVSKLQDGESRRKSKNKTEYPKKRKNKKNPQPMEHESISIARLQQQKEDIKVCENFYAKHHNEKVKKVDQNYPGEETNAEKAGNLDLNDAAEQLWKVQFAKLTEYKRVHGDCTVPARYNEDPKLGHWVMTQRRQFNLMKKGKASSMTVERIKLLNDIGFSWSIRIDPEKMWTLRYEQLKQYRAEFGDCLVPQRFARNPKLGTW